MIGVWVSDHEISYTVGKAIYDGLKPMFPDTELCQTVPEKYLKEIADINIGYGILRNMDAVWRKSARDNKPYFIVDRGYWKPSHYDGYYRISLRGTQQTTGLDKLEPDYARWEALGLEIFPSQNRVGGSLVCPVTQHVKTFFRDMDETATTSLPLPYIKEPMILREKGSDIPLQSQLEKCGNVVTFNSSVGWEALRQGIEVVSDPEYSIIGCYQKLVDKPLHLDINERRRLFSIQASLQRTLPEIREGKLWPLLDNLLMSQSGGIQEKLSPHMLQNIP